MEKEASKNLLEIKSEQENDEIETIVFENIEKLFMISNEKYEINIFCKNDSFFVTICKIKERNIFLFPSDEKVWMVYSSYAKIKAK